jgi:hypothetical protein
MHAKYYMVVWAIAALYSASAAAERNSARSDSTNRPPFDCPVSSTTDEKRDGFGNDYLRIVLPANATIIAPDRGGIWAPDGALKWKIGWERLVKGTLTISGKRIDSPSPPLRSELSNYGDFGFQASYLIFPSPGCWEVTGHVAEHSLTVVILALRREGEKPTPDQHWLVDRG